MTVDVSRLVEHILVMSREIQHEIAYLTAMLEIIRIIMMYYLCIASVVSLHRSLFNYYSLLLKLYFNVSKGS